MQRLLGLTLVFALAASAMPAHAQTKKTYYYRAATRDSNTTSSTANVYRRPSDDESAERTGKTRYTYTPHYRDRHLYSPYRYQPNVRYPQPPGHQRGVWWGVGSRLPSVYYAPAYVIDHQRYRLPIPPEGFRWVRVENDVYLVHSASGLVRDALYQMFY